MAAFLVLWLHLSGTFVYEKYFNNGMFEAPVDLGALGVSYFFVLSGFLIAYIHSRDIGRTERFISYAKKRIIRIYPVYWLVFGIAFMGMAVVGDGALSVPTGVNLLKSVLLIPMDENVVGGTGAPVLLVAWTLQYEMYFYLLFGIAILSRKLAIGCIAMIFVCFIAQFFISVPFLFRFLTSAHVVTFGLGAITSFAFSRFKISKGFAWLLIAVGLPVFVVAGHYHAVDLLGKQGQILAMAVPAALILFSLLNLERVGRSATDDNEVGGSWMGGRWLQFCGDASYSIYLVHLPLLTLMCKVSVKLGLAGHGPFVDSIIFGVQFLGCIAAGGILHVYFEKPTIGFLRNLLLNSPKPHVVNTGQSVS